jgi:hypothetical protein
LGGKKILTGKNAEKTICVGLKHQDLTFLSKQPFAVFPVNLVFAFLRALRALRGEICFLLFLAPFAAFAVRFISCSS